VSSIRLKLVKKTGDTLCILVFEYPDLEKAGLLGSVSELQQYIIGLMPAGYALGEDAAVELGRRLQKSLIGPPPRQPLTTKLVVDRRQEPPPVADGDTETKAGLKRELATCQAQRRQAERRAEECEKDKRKLEALCQQLQGAADSARATITRLTARNKELEEEVKALEADKASLEQDIKDLHQQLLDRSANGRPPVW